jgi:predicted nucleic acid-binding Zn ribbon protein
MGAINPTDIRVASRARGKISCRAVIAMRGRESRQTQVRPVSQPLPAPLPAGMTPKRRAVLAERLPMPWHDFLLQ